MHFTSKPCHGVCTYKHKLIGYFTRTSSLLQLAESQHPAAAPSAQGRLATEWISLKPVVTYWTLDRATEWQMRHISPLKLLQCCAAWGANWPCPMSGIPWMPASRSQTPADKVGRWMEKHPVFFFPFLHFSEGGCQKHTVLEIKGFIIYSQMGDNPPSQVHVTLFETRHYTSFATLCMSPPGYGLDTNQFQTWQCKGVLLRLIRQIKLA